LTKSAWSFRIKASGWVGGGAYVFKVEGVDEVGHVLAAPGVELGGDDVLVASGGEVLL
jgi:hypothetical protein